MKKNTLLEAKSTYEECLTKNIKGKRRRSSGIPFACKDAACKWAMHGGNAELQQATKRFNDMHKADE